MYICMYLQKYKCKMKKLNVNVKKIKKLAKKRLNCKKRQQNLSKYFMVK